LSLKTEGKLIVNQEFSESGSGSFSLPNWAIEIAIKMTRVTIEEKKPSKKTPKYFRNRFIKLQIYEN